MEMSRQRLRTGVLEASTKACPHCEGTGLMRTASSAGLSALRIIEDEAARGRGDKIMLRAGREAAIYVLNRKRHELADIEARYGVTLDIVIDEALEGARMSVESSGPRPTVQPRAIAAPAFEEEEEDIVEGDYDDVEEEEEVESEEREPRESREREPRGGEPRDEDGARRRRRRRRGGRGRSRRDEGGEGAPEGERDAALTDDSREAVNEIAEAEQPERDGDAPRARRGRRGGRGRSRREGGEAQGVAETVEPDSSPMVERPLADEPPIAEIEPAEEDKPKTRRRPRARKAAAAEPTVEAVAAAEPESEAKPKRRSRAKAKPESEAEVPEPKAPAKSRPKPALAVAPETAADNDAATDESPDNPRSGWWQRTFG
jgi:ribonuclease E